MNRVDFTFDNAAHYALYEAIHLDGSVEYYLELRDRSLINEFGLAIQFSMDSGGRLVLRDNDNPRKKELLETILLSMDREATRE